VIKNLFNGCNLRASLFGVFLVQFGYCFDLLFQAFAHALDYALLHTRQQQQSQQQPSSTHQEDSRHAAVALQPLRNHTTPHNSERVAPLHHTLLHAHLSPVSPTTDTRHSFTHSAAPPPPPLSHMPLLTKLIVFRRLNRPRLAHSGIRSSSFNCCSVQCELHVSGEREEFGRQARDASHVTPHHEAGKRTSEPA
jgi:hypothetical protein